MRQTRRSPVGLHIGRSGCISRKRVTVPLFALRRWPQELDLGVWADCGSEDCILIRPTHARLRIGAVDDTIPVQADDMEAVFEVDLPAGRAHLDAEFSTVGPRDGAQDTQSAYYVYVERLD